MEKSGFKISPKLNYRNSFAPVFIGRISETGSVINIYVRPNTIIVTFTRIWMTFNSFLLLVSIVEIIREGFNSYLLVPFILLIFGYVIFCNLFWREEKKARQLLENAFTSI